MNLITRPRRLRQHPQFRALVRNVALTPDDYVLPLFIRHGSESRPIPSMPGQTQWCLKDLPQEILSIQALKLRGVILFGIPPVKDELGSDSYSNDGIIQQAIPIIKKIAPELLVITDVCFCEYMSHGHCGVVNDRCGKLDVDNDETLHLLGKQALSHVQAGADVVAPSGNMDGMVKAIRQTLDTHQYTYIPILSYAIKYASSLYGPFRQAAEGTPTFGDRASYQCDPAHHGEALREAALDLEEGADCLMVKPGMLYLDVIHDLRTHFPGVPVAAYQVSGEYAMIKAAHEKGWVDEKKVVLESMIAFKRAGANFVITYFAKEVLKNLISH